MWPLRPGDRMERGTGKLNICLYYKVFEKIVGVYVKNSPGVSRQRSTSTVNVNRRLLYNCLHPFHDQEA